MYTIKLWHFMLCCYSFRFHHSRGMAGEQVTCWWRWIKGSWMGYARLNALFVCSPDLNPIEMMWAAVRRNVIRMRPANKYALRRANTHAWFSVPQSTIQRWYDHWKLRLQRCIDIGGCVSICTCERKRKKLWWSEKRGVQMRARNHWEEIGRRHCMKVSKTIRLL